MPSSCSKIAIGVRAWPLQGPEIHSPVSGMNKAPCVEHCMNSSSLSIN